MSRSGICITEPFGRDTPRDDWFVPTWPISMMAYDHVAEWIRVDFAGQMKHASDAIFTGNDLTLPTSYNCR